MESTWGEVDPLTVFDGYIRPKTSHSQMVYNTLPLGLVDYQKSRFKVKTHVGKHLSF